MLAPAAWPSFAVCERACSALAPCLRLLAVDDQPERQRNGHRQRERNPGDAGVPAEPIKELAEHGAAHETAGEITGEVNATRRAAISGGGAPDKWRLLARRRFRPRPAPCRS